jgi:hypothetical protein
MNLLPPVIAIHLYTTARSAFRTIYTACLFSGGKSTRTASLLIFSKREPFPSALPSLPSFPRPYLIRTAPPTTIFTAKPSSPAADRGHCFRPRPLPPWRVSHGSPRRGSARLQLHVGCLEQRVLTGARSSGTNAPRPRPTRFPTCPPRPHPAQLPVHLAAMAYLIGRGLQGAGCGEEGGGATPRWARRQQRAVKNK